MSKLVTIYGGSGFVGRYIARRMALAGWRVRVAVRRPNEALFVKTYGTVGQVEPVLCNIRDDGSVRAAMQGADAVVNCVGILGEQGRNTFKAIHHEAAERVAKLASLEKVGRLVHVSSLAADPDGESEYAKSKARGDEAVLIRFPSATILRPAVVFGAEDRFFNHFAMIAGFGFMVPVVGGKSLLQPVFVDDVAAAAEKAILGNSARGIFELGGPDVKPLTALVNDMLEVTRRRKIVLNLPFFAGSMIGFGLDMAQAVAMGLFHNFILTRDQVRLLKSDTIVSKGAKTLADFGIQATPYKTVIPGYLWRFRPAGEYSAIKESAKKLRRQ
jgi:NADH dehydrogenase